MSGGGRSNTDLRFLCSRYGLRPGVDVEVVQGDSVGRAKAFEDPTIAAVFARSQFLYWGTRAGFRPLHYPDPGMGWYEGGLAAGVALIARHPDVIQKVVNAVVRATDFLKTNEKEAVEVALKRIPQLSRDEAEGNYEILREGFVDNLEPSVIDYMSNVVGTVKASPRRASRWRSCRFVVSARSASTSCMILHGRDCSRSLYLAPGSFMIRACSWSYFSAARRKQSGPQIATYLPLAMGYLREVGSQGKPR